MSCISTNNQACKVRPEVINLNSNEPMFYPFSITTNKCSSSCNSINDPYAKICVPDAVKNLNVKEFNLMSRANETGYIKRHETCKCKCRFDANVCNNKQRWNDDKYWCECEELIDKGGCDKGYAWNPSNCEYECDKSCDVGEYLDHENCKCRKRLVDKLVEECSENIDEAKLTKTALFEHGNECVCSYTVCIVLAVIALTVSIGLGAYFTYKHISLNKENVSKYDAANYLTENGRSKTNEYQKLNLLFLQRHDQFQKFWAKFAKNWQKIIRKHWFLQHLIYYN